MKAALPYGLSQDLAALRAAWDAVPRESKLRRAGMVAAVAVGLTLTATQSLLFRVGGPIPWKIFPDARVVALLGAGALLGLYAAAGRRQRRVPLLWFALAIALVFHLEAATVHWFVDFSGSVTGARVDLVQLAATLLALGAVLALHAEVEAWRFADDLGRRGVPRAEAEAAARALADAGLRRAALLAGGVLVLGALVAVADLALGDLSVGPALVALAAGTALLGAAAWFALAAARGRAG